MTEYLRSSVHEYFDRRHLLVIIGTLLISLHTVDELGIFLIAQIFGLFTPLLDREFGGTDATGIYPVIGGAILIGLGIRLLVTMRRSRLAT